MTALLALIVCLVIVIIFVVIPVIIAVVMATGGDRKEALEAMQNPMPRMVMRKMCTNCGMVYSPEYQAMNCNQCGGIITNYQQPEFIPGQDKISPYSLAAFIASMTVFVFSIVSSIIGLVLGIYSYKECVRTGKRGKSYAKAAIFFSTYYLVSFALIIIGYIIAFGVYINM